MDEDDALSTKKSVSSNAKEVKREKDPIDDLNGLLKGMENMKLNKKELKKEKPKDHENSTVKQQEKKDKTTVAQISDQENQTPNEEEYIPLSMRMKKMYKGASIFN